MICLSKKLLLFATKIQKYKQKSLNMIYKNLDARLDKYSCKSTIYTVETLIYLEV